MDPISFGSIPCKRGLKYHGLAFVFCFLHFISVVLYRCVISSMHGRMQGVESTFYDSSSYDHRRGRLELVLRFNGMVFSGILV